MKTQKIIEKQDELITLLLSRELEREGCYDFKIRKIDDEISQLKAEVEVSDEDIEKWVEQKDNNLLDIELTDNELLHYKMGLCDGAKAMRDGKIKQIRL